ncbi:hypothetical protein KORDIASMS9_02254 [Kordia sp. SMS9]|uniref:hypothetical protein n=1 Tax=Kordia sp. SMS9 TaxID=2282170 RepID=UPI000E0CE1FA|nr:hypothetical protein [Kordia sp. SMS9]AXG70025.1 hypothetical protein KORDIASMS9_02254 [Kordia sp. SMS9]
MKKNDINNTLIAAGILFLIVAGYFFYDSFEYMLQKENSFIYDEKFGGMNKKYVGGDAYNFIIAGTYSTTIMLRSVVFTILGCVCLLLGKMK